MRLPICGGNWNNESNAGLAALNLNNPRSNVNNNIGSRLALLGCQKPAPYGALDRARQKRSRTPPRMGKHEQGQAASRYIRTPLYPPRIKVHTVNGIWADVIDFEKLYRAYGRAAARKRFIGSSMQFRQNMEENLIQIQNELIWRSYVPRPLRLFTIQEPKQRQIAAPHFRDRVVHHSLVAAIEPHFERRFISDSYACRKGRGTHQAMLKTRNMARDAKKEWGSYWVLKCDIKKYFPSIRHDLLKRTIRQTISDSNILWLLDTIIESHGDGRGIPIGALTSQLCANVYLDQLDHYLKDKVGIKYYIRYMDDFVIIGQTKKEMRSILEKVAEYLDKKLDLKLNSRTGIWPGRHGIDFCGYRIWPTHVLPRKRTLKTAKKKLYAIAKRYPDHRAFEETRKVIASFSGYIRHCNAWRSTLSVLERATYRPKGD